jgi:hypothetical protein
MAECQAGTAVGAGTVAGEAADEECATDSRAAQAVEDAQLESVRTSGAAPTGVPAEVMAQIQGAREAVVTQAETGKRQSGGPPSPAHHDSAEERIDLRQNQAGIGSRLDR